MSLLSFVSERVNKHEYCYYQFKTSSNESWPCDLKDAKQSGTAQHTDAERSHDVELCQDRLRHTADDDKAVEAVEHRDEVAL